jgi:outer membrane lipoprotein-sorting protein
MTRFLTRAPHIFFIVLFVVLAHGLFAQDILTANEFFGTVATNYATIEDYIADVTWNAESGTMTGTLTYKRPNRVRIDFTSPADQVLVSNGQLLMIYVPAFNVVLQQELRPGGSTGDLATADGLILMRRSYDIAYLEGPEPVPLDDGSEEFVTKLRLDRKQVTEGFRELVLSVDDTGFIRRIDGTTIDWEEVSMDLQNIRINQRVSDQVFEEDPDPSASVDENFLYDPEG